MPEYERFTLVGMPEAKVNIGCNNGEFGNKVERLLQQVNVRIVFGFVILRIHHQYRTGKHVHDVLSPERENKIDKAVGEVAVTCHVGRKQFQVIFVGQFPCHQQVNRFIESMPFVFLESMHQVVDINAPVIESSFAGYDLVVLFFISHYIADIGKTDQYAGTIQVPQSAFDIVGIKQAFVDLRSLYGDLLKFLHEFV